MTTLIVRENTLLKARPEQSTELPDNEKFFVARGEYGIKSAEKVRGHYKVVLDNPLGGRDDWYVFEGHVSVINAGTLVVTTETIFKTEPLQSGSLKDDQKATVEQRELAVKRFDERGSHLRVELVNPLNDRTDWYIYTGHVETLNIEDYKPPSETIPEPTKPTGRLIRIAGKGQVRTTDSIVPGGNFTWAEATKDGTRLPVNETITNNIIRMAKRMDEVRSRLGDRSITITSWYRPPAINRAVGGASRSTHLQGHGVDFVVAGLSPSAVQRQLDPWWSGGLGYGRTFTHLDNRSYRVRWNYG
ncbi:MAG: DUF882 domain-containing protein [Spirulinaceae cyanobacterium RM2_2_10]|nr:DUF882 domain-containing protein [Spirulinaceae cyanobacterium SM2_1_0]NJO20760.1 DUF882 domain-containing protein [Spirulinaceae cyanobacterium RM2_2_10]